jgi:hypothetical protein
VTNTISHSHTIPQSHNPTIPQSHNTTIPQYHNPTITQSHNHTPLSVLCNYQKKTRLTVWNKKREICDEWMNK